MKDIWKKLAKRFKDNKKIEWLIIDSTYAKAHQHSCDARGRNQAIVKHKKGLKTKIHLVVNKYSISIDFIVTDRSLADCKKAIHLIKNINV